MSSDRWGQEVPTLFEESACVQHVFSMVSLQAHFRHV